MSTATTTEAERIYVRCDAPLGWVRKHPRHDSNGQVVRWTHGKVREGEVFTWREGGPLPKWVTRMVKVESDNADGYVWREAGAAEGVTAPKRGRPKRAAEDDFRKLAATRVPAQDDDNIDLGVGVPFKA